MSIKGQLGEEIAILGTIDPQDQATTDKTSDWVAFDKFNKVAAYGLVGNVTGSVVCKLQEATDGTGTGAQDLTGKTNTFAAADDNKQCVLSVDRSELSAGFTHVACVMDVTGGTANLVAVAMLGAQGRYAPVAAHDLASVEAIIN